MKNYVQTIYRQLLRDIEAVPELKNVNVKSPLSVGDLVRERVAELKAHVKTNPFTDLESEIDFFKYDKPAIVAEHIFAQELYAIESGKPLGDKPVIEDYYIRELGYIRRVFDQNRFLYQYFQLDGTEFDELYFSTGKRTPDVNLPAAPDSDPEFSTPGDFVFARFIAFERLQNHLTETLYADKGTIGIPGETIQWTGEIINIVELIYGLYLTGQINHGNTSINELVRWAERQFGVKIGVIQRKLTEIQSRKRISATKFLDHMRDSLTQKLDEMSA